MSDVWLPVLTGRLQVFIPAEVLLRAEPADLERWRAQVRALVEQGWTITEREDQARWGHVLTMTPPGEPGEMALERPR